MPAPLYHRCLAFPATPRTFATCKHCFWHTNSALPHAAYYPARSGGTRAYLAGNTPAFTTCFCLYLHHARRRACLAPACTPLTPAAPPPPHHQPHLPPHTPACMHMPFASGQDTQRQAGLEGRRLGRTDHVILQSLLMWTKGVVGQKIGQTFTTDACCGSLGTNYLWAISTSPSRAGDAPIICHRYSSWRRACNRRLACGALANASPASARSYSSTRRTSRSHACVARNNTDTTAVL